MAQARSPTVSIVIPTYDRAALLPRAIESVIQQTRRDWELIVVDDGSTDGTRAYLETQSDPRIRTAFAAHSGVIATVRNIGASLSTGIWLAFLDSDDVWLPDKLGTQLAALDASPACGWSYTRYDVTDVAGRVIRNEAADGWQPYSGWILRPLLTVEARVATSTVMVRRELFEKVGGYDSAYPRGEDYELYFRIGAFSPACAVPEPLAHIRKHPQQVQQGASDPHVNFARMYLQARERTSDPVIARLCLKQCARRHVASAQHQSRRGNHQAAFAALRRSLSHAGPSGAWCAAAVGCAWRALTVRPPSKEARSGQ